MTTSMAFDCCCDETGLPTRIVRLRLLNPHPLSAAPTAQRNDTARTRRRVRAVVSCCQARS
jgi:hypothetical protein